MYMSDKKVEDEEVQKEVRSQKIRGYLWLYCGLGLIIIGILFIILGVIDGSISTAPVLARMISSFIIGLVWIGIGARKLNRTRNIEKMQDIIKQIDENIARKSH